MTNSNPQNDGALAELAADPASRAAFLKKMGGGVAGASAFALFLAACGGSKNASSTTTEAMTTTSGGAATANEGDLKIVNYALTLEYLEADFYDKVVASGLFKGTQLDLIKAIQSHEHAHVAALKGTAAKLGTPAAKPKTKFPVKSAAAVLSLAATVENICAAAYLGQAGNIKSKEILAAAISIHSVEARHASALNMLIGKSPTPDGGFAAPLSMAQVLPKVKPFIVA